MWGLARNLRGRSAFAWWPHVWRRRRWPALVKRILSDSERLGTLSAEELRQAALECRDKVKLEAIDNGIVIRVFALVREIAGRTYGLRHHPVQILGALAIFDGQIAEMRTGEGKTLTSLMTITLLALDGRGCHVYTANDYLAMRDGEFAKPVLAWFDLTIGVLQSHEVGEARATCYRADVTYGSEKEFAFDFLRDRLDQVADLERGSHPPKESIQNGLVYAVIDEADSILIDQATTPMIISYPHARSPDEVELDYWCENFANEMIVSEDYAIDRNRQSVRLTQRGCRKFQLSSHPAAARRLPVESLFTQIERAILARQFFCENQEYLVVEGKLEIIDQGTGRILPGRKWRDGLQQAIEIRAGLKPSNAMGSAARVTLQSYLRRYELVCGMTGTAIEVRSELRKTYGLAVSSIPSHRPSQLMFMTPRIFDTMEHKWEALFDELERIVAAGRAALVGTSSIVASEHCGAVLKKRGMDVRVLHAKHHQQESEIIRQAGEPRRITVATNMAGRGTDIKLHPSVRAAGGLFVVLSEMNRSARIDRQLAGRAGRQGDPGSCQMFVSIDDELLTILGSHRVFRLRRLASQHRSTELDKSWFRHFEKAQWLFEKRAESERHKLLLHERQQREIWAPLGLDPFVELPSEE